MSTAIAINGSGRIGRDFLRFVLGSDDLEIVAINDVTDCATLARLLRHDGTFGPLRASVTEREGALVVVVARSS